MPSLRHLLDAHATLLLVDASSTRVQAGLWQRGDLVCADWETSETEAGVGVFACVEALLARASQRGEGNVARIADVGAFIFCEGPGSVLGIRTSAVALRTWQALGGGASNTHSTTNASTPTPAPTLTPTPTPAYSYQSLDVVAHSLRLQSVTVIADARRDSWHAVATSGDAAFTLRRIPAAQLAAVGPLVMPAGFRHWTPLPPGVATTSYDLAALLPALADDETLFRPAPEPDAFMHEEPSYVTWTAQVHQLPPPPPPITAAPSPAAHPRS